jgi:hypothetical protein
MQLTPSELQAFNNAYYEISALQFELQLLRMQLLLKANFNPNQPRVPRGNRDGGRWARVGAHAGGDNTPARSGADRTGVREPAPRSGIESTTLPGDRRIVRDRSGTEPWEAYVEALRPDGSVSERVVVNRDGSAIRSQYSTTPELTGWDESHTVIGAGGGILTCQNLGKTQTILDERGQVVQVSTWTERGPRLEPRQPDPNRLFGSDDPGFGGAGPLGLALPLFAWFASMVEPNRAAVFALRARDYLNIGDETKVQPLFIGEIDEAEVNAACPAIDLVRRLTNKAAEDAQLNGPYPSPREYGTAVHTLLKLAIGKQKNADLAAEVSLFKSGDVDRGADYGELGSIRIDVFDNTAKDGTVCVYDIKTGERGLSGPRSAELVNAVLARWPETKRIIVIEVRPTVPRPRFKGIQFYAEGFLPTVWQTDRTQKIVSAHVHSGQARER